MRKERKPGIITPQPMATISRKEMERLIAEKHDVYFYPRQKLVRVDGFRFYKLVD